jgi:hypothetical protein
MPTSWHNAAQHGITLDPLDLDDADDKITLTRTSDGATCRVFKLSKFGKPNIEVREDGAWICDYTMKQANDTQYGFKVPPGARTVHTPASGKSGSSTVTIDTVTHRDPAPKTTITTLCYRVDANRVETVALTQPGVTAITKDPYDILVIHSELGRRKVNSKAWLWYDEHEEEAA